MKNYITFKGVWMMNGNEQRNAFYDKDTQKRRAEDMKHCKQTIDYTKKEAWEFPDENLSLEECRTKYSNYVPAELINVIHTQAVMMKWYKDRIEETATQNEKLEKIAETAMKMKRTWDEFDKVNEREIEQLTQQNKELEELWRTHRGKIYECDCLRR